MLFVDTHCHIQDDKLISNVESVVNNAFLNDVKIIVVNGCDTVTNKLAIELGEKFDSVYAAVGYHPTEEEDVNIKYIEETLKLNKVVAIGEIGLDYYYTKENAEFQKSKLIKQLDLAVKYDKPVIIHNRNATDDLYHILKNYKGKIRGIIHCFSGSIETANMFINLGFFLGIGGVLTFKNNTNLREALKNIPIDKVVLETDSPYLAPEPYRGSVNEPKHVVEVAKMMANIYNLSLEEVSFLTSKNALDLFEITGQI